MFVKEGWENVGSAIGMISQVYSVSPSSHW
jgi:hypothetical protein